MCLHKDKLYQEFPISSEMLKQYEDQWFERVEKYYDQVKSSCT